MSYFVNFEVENAEMVEEQSDSQFATAKIRAFSSDRNRHDLYCSEETLKQTAPTIYHKPILYYIDNILDDFYTHVSPDKSLIAGFVVPGSAEFSRLEDGRLSLNVLAKVWKRYAPKVIQLFQRDSGQKKVSVEMELFDTKEMPNGLAEMQDFAYAGITILGDYITEASPGANMEFVSFSDENEKFYRAYSAEFNDGYYDVDFSIPEEVKRNSQDGLNLYNSFGRGGTGAGLAMARFIIKNKDITPKNIHNISRYFSKKNVSLPTDKQSNEWIAWQLWGGTEGRSWAFKLSKELNDIDSESMRFFDNFITFPYNSLKDANPAIRGIDPPVSLGQANQIAKEAEGIGVNKEKNGWAIAISNFKKRHKVVNGRWVRKEKMDFEQEENVTKQKDELDNVQDTDELEDVKDQTVTMAEEEQKKEDKEEKEEEDKEEQEEQKEEKMASNYSFDFGVALSMFGEGFEHYTNLSAEFAKEDVNYQFVAYAMFEKMCGVMKEMGELKKMNEAYMAENEELKKFKAEKEKEQFNFAIDLTLKELEERVEIPEDELDALREKAKEFSLENLDAWKNLAKAKALDFAIKKDGEARVVKYQLPFTKKEDGKINGSPWTR